jgi:hypothetical protein
MQGTRDGRGRESEDINLRVALFDAFLMGDAKAVLFIDDQQPKILNSRPSVGVDGWQ